MVERLQSINRVMKNRIKLIYWNNTKVYVSLMHKLLYYKLANTPRYIFNM